jgi:hypothetical protein
LPLSGQGPARTLVLANLDFAEQRDLVQVGRASHCAGRSHLSNAATTATSASATAVSIRRFEPPRHRRMWLSSPSMKVSGVPCGRRRLCAACIRNDSSARRCATPRVFETEAQEGMGRSEAAVGKLRLEACQCPVSVRARRFFHWPAPSNRLSYVRLGSCMSLSPHLWNLARHAGHHETQMRACKYFVVRSTPSNASPVSGDVA